MLAAALQKHSRWLMVGSAIVIYAVFVTELGRWLWGREHYQFFPLVLLAAGGLAWHRLQGMTWHEGRGLSLRTMVLGGISLLLLLLAVVLNSNWFGALSALSFTWMLIRHFGGQDAADRLRGPVAFLLLALPIPMNYDLQLIIGLQKVASRTASQLLDWFQVRHNLSGVALATEHRSFMVEEACSGIHSLFSCLCAMVFIGVLQRYGLIRILINIAQTAVWVVAANAGRVFLVVYAAAVYDVALDSGWRHEVLGLFTYAGALLMSLSTDRLLAFLVPPASTITAKTDLAYGESDNPLTQLTLLLQSTGKNLNKHLDRERLSAAGTATILALVVLLICGPLSLVTYAGVLRQWVQAPVVQQTVDPGFIGSLAEQLLGEDVLPAEFGDWRLTDVSREERDPGDPFGENSIVFTYAGAGLVAAFSVDGTYPEWHDLAYCYSAMDWKLSGQTNYRDSKTENHATQLSMYTPAGRQLLSYFSCIDSQLQSVRPGEQSLGRIPTLDGFLARLGWASDTSSGDISTTPPVWQLQLTCITEKELLTHEKQRLKDLFGGLSQAALAAMKEKQQ